VKIVSFFSPIYLKNYPEAAAHDYPAMLAMLGASCRRLGLRHLVITDRGTPLEHECFRLDLPRSLMRAVVAGQLAYLQSAAFDEDTVFIDADCLVQHSPARVFAEPFDLAVTARRWGPRRNPSPINNGTIFCRAAARAQCVAFFTAASMACGKYWGADQDAMGKACQPMPKLPGLHERSGASVRFLDVAGHNQAPRSADDPTTADAVVLHFRGPRKSYMRAVFDRIMA